MNPKFKDYLYIIIYAILSGGIVFGGKVFSNLGLSLYQISWWPFLISFIALLPLLVFKKFSLDWKSWPLYLAFGLFSVLSSIFQFAAVVVGAPVAIALLLLYTQPIWTIIFSKVILKEKSRSRDWLAIILVLFGILILLNPGQGEAIKSWLGIILALLGGLSLSGWMIMGRLLSKKGGHPISSFFGGYLFMNLIMLLLYLPAAKLIPTPLITGLAPNFSATIWIAFILYSLIIILGGHLLYLKGVAKVPAVQAGVITLLEPVAGAILAAIFLKEALFLNIIIGGLLILIANYLVIKQSA